MPASTTAHLMPILMPVGSNIVMTFARYGFAPIAAEAFFIVQAKA